VRDLQITQGGPIIMMQVENEYGSYANDEEYLRKMVAAMRQHGVETPLVTSDGPWHDMLENGSIKDLALPTINCGSNIKENFEKLRRFHGEKRPLMVMEFWIGWFDAWGDDQHHTTSTQDAVKELQDCLALGSVNIYMFHGGTNFGFMNGSNYYERLAPDVTSYDYDALLTEWGEPTAKYQAFKKVIADYAEIPEFPLSMKIERKAYGTFSVKERVSLFSTIDTISQPIISNYPLSMEACNQATGYIYYRSLIGSAREIADYRLINTMDRAHTFINQELLRIDYDQEIGQTYSFDLSESENELGILVENMGRVNYSVKMNHQHKGIKDGVIINGAFQSNWEIFPLPMDNLHAIDFQGKWQKGQPSFSRFECVFDECADTFIELPGWGKGFVQVNGHTIGRFWEKGPQQRLYVPAPFLKIGMNEIIVFESDGKIADEIVFHDQADLGPEA